MGFYNKRTINSREATKQRKGTLSIWEANIGNKWKIRAASVRFVMQIRLLQLWVGKT